MQRGIRAACAAVVATLVTSSSVSAATIFWQGTGVSGTLTDANYSDGTLTNLAPTSADVVNFGGGGTATHSVAGATSFSKLRVGHAEAPGGTGTGVVTVNNGAQINLTGGAAGSDNAGLWVGAARSGTLNIDGAGSSVTSNRLIIIGFANNRPNDVNTVNVTNGGALISSVGNIDLGTNPGTAGQNGTQGHLVVSGTGSTVSAMSANADLNIGIRKTGSSVTQSGGLIEIDDVIEVGFNGDGTIANANSSFNISGGTTTHGGNFFLGRGASTGATVNISGGTLNTGNRYLMGAVTASGVVTNHSAGTLNVDLDVRVGDAGTPTATYNLSGAGVINTNLDSATPGLTAGFIGRQGTAEFNQTGGTANWNGIVHIGNRETATNANSGLYKISAGDMNVTTDLTVATNGTGQLRVVGDDATIDVGGALSVNNTANGVGTLAFEFESGDLLSMINVTGTATFASGAALVLDTTNADPTLLSYDLLTATDITDNGLAFSGPAGWSYQIVSGGNGEILQAVVPEPASLGLIAMAGLMGLRRRRA